MGDVAVTSPLCVVPILLYHAVSAAPGSQIAPFSVPPDEFRRHLDVLTEGGYTSVTFGDLVRGELDGIGPPDADRRVVLTFDDGYADFAQAALPALRERSLVSTLFVTTGWLEGRGRREPGPTDRMLAWSQLTELLECGVEVGAHSHSHPQLDTLTAGALRNELERPRSLLQEALGRPVDSVAYPHGYNGPRVRRATQAAGYRSAAAVRNALHRWGEDPFAVARLTVTRSTTAGDVARWLEGTGVGVAPPDESLATRGWRAYRRGRAILRRRPGSDYR